MMFPVFLKRAGNTILELNGRIIIMSENKSFFSDAVNKYFDAIESVLSGQDKARECLTDIQRKARLYINEYVGTMTYDIVSVKKDKALADKKTAELSDRLDYLNKSLLSVINDFYSAEKLIEEVRKSEELKSDEGRRIVSQITMDIKTLCDTIEKRYGQVTKDKETLLNGVKGILNTDMPLNTKTAEKLAYSISEQGDALKKAELLTVRDLSSAMYQGCLSNLRGRDSITFDTRPVEKTVDVERYQR